MMKNTYLYLLIILIAMTNACSTPERVDLIVKNAKIYTLSEDFVIAEAFAIKNGKFVAVGNTDEICSKFLAEEIIDLDGQYVYPGFIDAHAHFFGYGQGIQTEAQLFDTQSEEAILNLLDSFQKERQNAWILGRGWDQNDWPTLEFPTKDGLDKLFPEVPVYLVRIDGHAAWVNSKALELAGIRDSIII